jgi:hypothetical protein
MSNKATFFRPNGDQGTCIYFVAFAQFSSQPAQHALLPIHHADDDAANDGLSHAGDAEEAGR